MAKKGRPTTYFDLIQPRLDEIESWAGQGLTREEIANRLGTTTVSIWRYEKSHEDLSNALKRGDELIVTNVEAALAKKALGGDVTAMIFFLKNKAPRKWRDKQDIEHSGGMSVAVQASPEAVEAAMRKIAGRGNG